MSDSDSEHNSMLKSNRFYPVSEEYLPSASSQRNKSKNGNINDYRTSKASLCAKNIRQRSTSIDSAVETSDKAEILLNSLNTTDKIVLDAIVKCGDAETPYEVEHLLSEKASALVNTLWYDRSTGGRPFLEILGDFLQKYQSPTPTKQSK